MELLEAFSPLLPAIGNPTIITHLEDLTISNVIFLHNFHKYTFCDFLIKMYIKVKYFWGNFIQDSGHHS